MMKLTPDQNIINYRPLSRNERRLEIYLCDQTRYARILGKGNNRAELRSCSDEKVLR